MTTEIAPSSKPVVPPWIFKFMNPVMKALLRSPLHSILSGNLMLISYTGRKSGKQYTIPIGYFEWGDGEIMAYSSLRWWTNLRDGNPVTLLVKDQRFEAIPTVIEEREAVISTLAEFIKRLGLKKAKLLMTGIPMDHQPTSDELHTIPPGRTFIHLKIVLRG